MRNHDHSFQFNFKFSQCKLLDETSPVQTLTTSNISSTGQKKNKNKKQIQEEQVTQSNDTINENVTDLDIYDKKLLSLCGLWEDYPRHYYRMEFRIEMGQLVGYSNVNNRKALVSFDGDLINMIIIHPKETGRPLDHYRGRLGWNKKYIIWEKEDLSTENGWRSTRRWIKIE